MQGVGVSWVRHRGCMWKSGSSTPVGWRKGAFGLGPLLVSVREFGWSSVIYQYR